MSHTNNNTGVRDPHRRGPGQIRDRIYQLHSILHGQHTPIARAGLMSRLECSEQTAYRLIRIMRDYLGAPLADCRPTKGKQYEKR